jgi:hypothetical protein
MSIVPVPGREGEFLAVQGFYPGYDAAGTQVASARLIHDEWRVAPLFALPYLHRFDILERNGTRYLICCTLV